MTFTQAVSAVFSKYAVFSGRARRSEYWYFTLFTCIVSTALTLIFGEASIFASIFSLVTLLPGLSVFWRRMHDIGKSGAWFFIALVPIVGAILLLVWLCRDSEAGDNAYGPNPKA